MSLEQALNLPGDIVAQQCGTPGSDFARSVRAKALALEATA